MKPAHELGLLNLAKFSFHYNIIWAMSSLEGKNAVLNSKCGNVTYDCEHGVRATMHDRESLVHVARASQNSCWFATSKPVTRT